MENVENKAVLGSHLLLGNCAITEQLRQEGYAYTIAAEVISPDGRHLFQDLYCTESQLRDLAAVIINTLERRNRA